MARFLRSSLFLCCSTIDPKIRKCKVRTGPEIPVRRWFVMAFFFVCFTELSLVRFQEFSASGDPKTINIALWEGLRPVSYLVTVKW